MARPGPKYKAPIFSFGAIRPLELKQSIAFPLDGARIFVAEISSEPHTVNDNLVADHSAAIRELTSLSERDLQAKIVEPLLRSMGFENVRDTSGSVEHGKDLIATKSHVLGTASLYAIQIKKFRPTARVASTLSFGQLLDQLRQALEQPTLDPGTNQLRKPDECIFITPFPIPVRAKVAFSGRLAEPTMRMVHIVDGHKLLELIGMYAPILFARFSMETQYKLRVAHKLDSIAESAVAFQRPALGLDSLYVNTSLSASSTLLEVIGATRSKRQATHIPIESKAIPALVQSFHTCTNLGQSHFLKMLSGNRKKGIVSLNLEALLVPIRQKVRAYIRSLEDLSKTDTPEARCAEIVSNGISLQRGLAQLSARRELKSFFDGMKESSQDYGQHKHSVIMHPASILKIRDCMHFVGKPGSGKTTLLRRLAQHIARHDSAAIPLFIQLVQVDEPTYGSLLEACSRELVGSGFSVQRRERLTSLMNSGQVRLCLDGLDEVGSKASQMLGAIEEFVSRHDKCQVLLSSRDNFESYYWDRAFMMRLEPFSNRQLAQFVARWFSSEPSSRMGLLDWLNRNDTMIEAARTPLIAGLLCSLFEVDADMPTTELELYERRFELFLGKWERAKRLPPLSTALRNRYLHFLMETAFFLQTSERRTITTREANEIAIKYYSPKYHMKPDALVVDCIKRDVLELTEAGVLSFGHFTYQEYLAGEWLAHSNPATFIWQRIKSAWWKKTIEFYAARKMDITRVVAIGCRERSSIQTMERILELVRLAPFTSKKVLHQFRTLPRLREASHF